MNNTVKRIVDILFQDAVENDETLALHEEVMNNCQEHFDDLVARGMTEDEAVGVIVESLKGMKDVIDEYPRKDSTAQPETDGEVEKGHWRFRGIERIRTELKEQDLEVSPSADDQVHLYCSDPERITWNLNGGQLTVTGVNMATRTADAVKAEEKPEMTLNGILNYVGRILKNVSTQIVACEPVRIDIPADMIREADLNAASGDITWRASLATTMSAHTASGDIDIDPMDESKADKIHASTASGDITLKGTAEEAEISSISGDAVAEGIVGFLKVKSVSGDAEFSGCVDTLTLQSVSGSAEAHIENISVRRIEAKSTSGDVEIDLPDDIGSVHAECSSRSGDCTNQLPDGGSGAGLQIRASSISGDVRIES